MEERIKDLFDKEYDEIDAEVLNDLLFDGQVEMPMSEEEIMVAQRYFDFGDFFRNVSGKETLICSDFTLIDKAPVRNLSKKLEYSIDLSKDYGDGCDLSMIDLCVLKASLQIDGVFAGYTKDDDSCRFIFYAESVDGIEEILDRNVKEEFPQLMRTITVEEDSEWKTYFSLLYPSEYEMQHSENTGYMLERISTYYEDPGKERPVTHLVGFNSEEDAEKFKADISDDGFYNASVIFDSEKEYPYIVACVRDHAFTGLDDITDILMDKAKLYNGKYKAWDCEVIPYEE